MDKESIRSIWSKFLEVQEGMYGKKKEGMDPVGKADDDIDNDGDVDSSDKYLKNRRKAIGKAMKKDDEKEVKEGAKDRKDPKDPHGHKKAAQKPLNLNPNKTKKVKTYEGKMDDEEELDEGIGSMVAKKVRGLAPKVTHHGKPMKENEEEDEVECPKCEGEGCDHCDGKGYHETKKEWVGKEGKNRRVAGGDKRKEMEESNLFSDDELAALEEKMKHIGNPPGNVPSDPAEPEKFMQTSSAGEKKFYDDHEKGNEKKYEDWEDTSEHDGVNAGRAVKSQSPARKGDNLKVGDNAMPTVKKVKGQ